jgi:NAD(P)H-flavin reductase
MSASAMSTAVGVDPMLPVPYRVVDRTVETPDSATLRLEPVGARLPRPNAGQFCMLYARGIGEVAISISDAWDGTLVHTIRDVGAVSRALSAARPGALLGVRGPFGTDWGLAAGGDVVIVAGGVGLAPLRPVVLDALRRRAEYRRVTLIAGARSPGEFLFRGQLAEWAARPDLDVQLTVDRPEAGWEGGVGFVTEPLGRLDVDPATTTAFLCGPEPMMRFSANVLLDKGVAAQRIRVSLERNMQCGIGVCGHCQLGPLLVCRDGPVVDYATAEPLLEAREL